MFMSRFIVRTASAPLFALVLATAGCHGHDDEEGHEHPDPDVEACEHLKEGPPAPLTAAGAFSVTAPAVSNDHKRYDVTLAGTPGARVGFVSFAVAKAGEYIVYTGSPVKLAMKSAAMADVAAESSATSVTTCAEVKGRSVYDLAVGTYVLSFGPEAALEKVSLVLEAGAQPHAH